MARRVPTRGAEGAQVTTMGEAEVICAPRVVAGVSVERAHRRGIRRLFARTPAANHEGLPLDAHIELRRAAQVFLGRGNFAAEHFLVPVHCCLRIVADEVDVVERDGRFHLNCGPDSKIEARRPAGCTPDCLRPCHKV